VNLEIEINTILQQFPKLKKNIKKIYQSFFVLLSLRKQNSCNLIQLTPNDGYEYFFGYYDKSPWDISNRYVLCLKVKRTYKDVAPKEPANIVLIDTKNDNEIKVLGQTHAWNVQQGCMLQWLGPDFKDKIIFNDFRDNHYCSVILSINNHEEKIFDMPIYSVNKSANFALTLDFSRLHRLRKGYGYSNIPDKTKGILIPNGPCIWRVDLKYGSIKPIIYYNDLYCFESRDDMISAEHKVNHIMISPNGKRFMFLHRWIKKQKKYSRLITCDADGSNMYNLLDHDMVSHCSWKNDEEIIVFANMKKIGVGYYLLKDKSHKFKHLWPGLVQDGHPSYSPNLSLVVTDSYPNRIRMSNVYCMTENDNPLIVAKVFMPFKYDNETRCDLHPRWSHSGKYICVDSVIKRKRALCYLEIDNEDSTNK